MKFRKKARINTAKRKKKGKLELEKKKQDKLESQQMKEGQKNQDKKKAEGVLILDDEVFDDEEGDPAGNTYTIISSTILF